MKVFERILNPFAPAEGPPPQSAWAFVRWMLKGAERPLGWFTLVAVLSGFAEAAAALLLGWIVDLAASHPPERFFADYWVEVVLVALFFLLVRPILMSLTSGFHSRALAPGLFLLGALRLHRHTLGQSMAYFEDDFAGRIAQKETQTGLALSDAVNETINAITYGLATVIGAAIVLLGVDWRLAAVLGVWFAAYLWLVSYFLPRIRAHARAKAETRAGITGQFVDSLSHMQTVKLFAHAGREEEAAHAATGRHWQTALRMGRVVWLFRTSLAILAGALPAAMISVAIWIWSLGDAGPGVIALAGLLSTRLSQMSGWISFTAMGIFTNIGVIEDGMKTLAPEHAITDAPDAVEPGQAHGAIVFERVSFGYGRPEGGGVRDLSLTIRPGEKVALVGPSGAGKSTTIALLLRLYDVEAGRITLGGQDIRDLTQDGLRRQISTVTQDPAMFNRSALDNILYGRPEAGRAAAIAAAKQVAAHDFVQDLADKRGRRGYDAHLGEDGVKLSGGQRQRVALARAVLKDAPILILDEATSALDSEVEAAIQAALEGMMEGRTVLAIAHRLSTIRKMDRIVVLDDGRIIEEGRHEDLLVAGGLYARLWRRQSGGFLQVTETAAE